MKAKEETINELNAQLAAIAEERKAELLGQLRVQHTELADELAPANGDAKRERIETQGRTYYIDGENPIDYNAIYKEIENIFSKKQEHEIQNTEAWRQLQGLGATIEDLGLGVTTARKLIAAVKKYGGVEKGLRIFRDVMATRGFAGVDDDVCPIVSAYGTIRDKTLLIAAILDAKNAATKDLEKTANTIMNNILQGIGYSRDEQKEYAYYLANYAALYSVRDLFVAATAKYMLAATIAANTISTHEDLLSMEWTFNTILPALANPKEISDLQQKYNSRQFGRIVYKGGVFVDEQAPKIWEKAECGAKEAAERLAELKGLLMALKRWAEDKGTEDFIPWIYRDYMARAQETSHVFGVMEKYYKSHINALKESGETISEEDMKTAILPDFDGTEANPYAAEITKKRILKEYDSINKTLPF